MEQVMSENRAEESIVEAKLQQMEQGSSGATENQQVYEENLAKLDKLLADGHKLMLAQSFDDASVVLCNAAELASKCFGDFAPQSFLPHFNYGQALIEVARLESLLVKPPVEDTDESDGEDEAEAQNEQAQGKEESDKAEKEGHLKETEEQKGEEKKEEKGGEEGKDQPQMEESDGQQNNPREEKTDNGREEGLEDECREDAEEDDIQIAWENLEVARKICENQMKDADQMELWVGRKADVLVALGECMTVSENFPLALDEFTKALDIRKELFGDADRRVAEVHFWIGRTHKLMNDFKNAAEHFGNAMKMLEAVIASKETELREKGEETRENLSQELEELKDAVKGVQENVQDAVDSLVEQRKRDEAMKALLQPLLMQAVAANGSNAQELNDVTALLKRKATKRPLETTEALGNDKAEAINQQNAKVPKKETDNEKDGEQQTNDCEKNGN